MINALWDEVLADPLDEEARKILADALLDAGDPRGELIQLQTLPSQHQTSDVVRRCAALIDDHWDDWLGPLGRMLDREATVFRFGFLDEILITRVDPIARGHRELATVRAVAAARTVPDDHLLDFIADLPTPPISLAIARPITGATLPMRGLRVSFTTGLLDIAPTFPAIEQLELAPSRFGWDPGVVPDLVRQLPSVFPLLRSIVLDVRNAAGWSRRDDPADAERTIALATAAPLVTIAR